MKKDFFFFRRDEIDSTHFPVFHQCEGVRLVNAATLFKTWGPENETKDGKLDIFDSNGERNDLKQQSHTLDAAKMLELDLKKCLLGLTQDLFGKGAVT